MKSFRLCIKEKLDHFLADPQLTPIEMMQKQVAFNWTIGTVISVLILTIFAYAIQANIIGHYGVVLLLLYAIDIPLFRRPDFSFYLSIFLAAIIITTFVFIVIFGGYTNSAGLVFVGLTCVMSSTLNNSRKAVILLFVLYVSTIIGLAVLNPYLTRHPDITPGINFTFFVINTIWMSAAMMFFIFQYLNERNKYQLLETNRLQELDRVKNELFTNITHEFRTPITIIDGMASQISAPDKATKNAIDMIRAQSRKLLNLVNQILDLARIDHDSLQVDLIQGDVIEFLRYQAGAFRSAMEARGISYNIDIKPEKVMMDFDAVKLEAIITNLLSNAQKFTPEGGAVSVCIHMSPDGKLVIEVKDTGIGISQENQARIFDRFFQVKKDKYMEGNGIGLTIVKVFANLLNGNIELESEEGVGTKFKLIFPISTTANMRKPLVRSGDGIVEKEMHKMPKSVVDEKPLLLIVDDNGDIIQYLKVILNERYKILVAENGEEGFSQAREFVPDIILSDVMMPGLDGFGFLKKLKAEVTTSHIPVLMLTAKTDREAKLEGLELGAEAYLAKPFDQEELLIRIRKLLDLRKVLHQRFEQIHLEGDSIHNSENIEDRFVSYINAIIDQHLDDDHFSVQILCREIGMSHTQLYRKFSAVTDIPVNKYIRRYRLHKAMNLIRDSNLNISQVAIEVGMPNLAYFSRVFKEEFHTNPSAVKRTVLK